MDVSALAQNTSVLPWQQQTWHSLAQRFPNIPHGLLFYGKQGCGKQQFAAQFSKWLLCTDKQPQAACGHCPSCHWIAAGTHPQLKLINAEFDEKKQTFSAIKIEQIREINHFIEQKVDGWRLIVIQPAQKMNIAAANALLKTLEEPGERVLLLLLCESPLQLAATIRSRLQHFALDRLSHSHAMDYLQQQGMADDVNTQMSLALAENMPLQAYAFTQSAWYAKRQDFFESLLRLVKDKNKPLKWSSQWAKTLEIRDIIVILRYIIVDCVSYKLQQPIKQCDVAISELASEYCLEQLFEIYKYINQTTVMLNQNIQAQLILDQLAIQLMNIRLADD